MTEISIDDLEAKIRDVPDFPKPGIVFKDIMPLLADPTTLQGTVDHLADWAAERQPDIVLGAEARGFITGGALACRLGCGFAAARKPLRGRFRARRPRRRHRRALSGPGRG